MNRSLIVIAALALCSLAQADEVNRCVAAGGEVTLTDAPCPPDAPAAAKTAPAAAARSGTVEHVAMAGIYSRHDNFVPKQSPSHGLARDVATLKLAHQTMLLLDSTAAAMRQQRLASR